MNSQIGTGPVHRERSNRSCLVQMAIKLSQFRKSWHSDFGHSQYVLSQLLLTMNVRNPNLSRFQTLTVYSLLICIFNNLLNQRAVNVWNRTWPDFGYPKWVWFWNKSGHLLNSKKIQTKFLRDKVSNFGKWTALSMPYFLLWTTFSLFKTAEN